MFLQKPATAPAGARRATLSWVVVSRADWVVRQSRTASAVPRIDRDNAAIDSTCSPQRPICMKAASGVFAILPSGHGSGARSGTPPALGGTAPCRQVPAPVPTVFVLPALLLFVIKMEKKKVSQCGQLF